MLFCFVDLMVILYTGGHSAAAAAAAETKHTHRKQKTKIKKWFVQFDWSVSDYVIKTCLL